LAQPSESFGISSLHRHRAHEKFDRPDSFRNFASSIIAIGIQAQPCSEFVFAGSVPEVDLVA
jgi:hypothetical protein